MHDFTKEFDLISLTFEERQLYHEKIIALLDMMGWIVADRLRGIELLSSDSVCVFALGPLDYFLWSRQLWEYGEVKLFVDANKKLEEWLHESSFQGDLCAFVHKLIGR